MPLQSIELVLSGESDRRVRDDWDALAAAGLPSQARHAGASNAPHVTVLAASRIAPEAERATTDAFSGLLPRQVSVAGIGLLGAGPYALVYLLAPDTDLLGAMTRARSTVEPLPQGWVAHVTLVRRLGAADVERARDVLDAVGRDAGPLAEVTATGLRRWDPDARRTLDLI